ncbi:LysR family transcriptional regulator [Ralstonia insidiosa]|uniref:LysR family transcriptional regulator n=1 Tax=Ralstonia insidiosa TaxID=190721 RepID=A0A848P8S1_9RALS|nr:LysR family transcriptional regulator [Ralstonia insidiosa]NMV41735.1 LysR family transcriptional regulator [Ralstonia insidiosa]
MALTHRHVEVFRALMTAGSVTKAATLLFTSQPTVSRELARIEQVVGFKLFDRSNGRLRPTAAALTLFDEVKQFYVGLERVASTVAHLRAFKGGGLSVLTLPMFSQTLLPGACHRFFAGRPDATLAIEAQESPFLEEWLCAQRFDLGLTEQSKALPGTRLEPLLEIDEVCVLHDGHPLLAKRKIALSDFSGANFISLSPADPYRLLWDEAFARQGVVRNLLIEAPTAAAVCSLVQKRLGIAIVNPLTAMEFVPLGLHVRPLRTSFPFRVNLLRAEHRPANHLVEPFTRALREEVTLVAASLKRITSVSSAQPRTLKV